MWRFGVAVALVAMLALPGTALAATGQQVSVNGAGEAPVPDGATTSQQQAAYDQALNAAIGDAQAKAQMVAQQLSLTLGPVQSFTEQSDDFLGYCGVGFLPGAAATGISGSASAPKAAASNGQLTPIPAKHKKHKHKKKAHRAQSSESACQVQADVTMVYTTG
jgi:hypothetical protein